MWPLAVAELEERDAPQDVLDRWVPLGLAVAHAVRRRAAGGQQELELQSAVGSIAGGARKSAVRKWATTDFSSGDVTEGSTGEPSEKRPRNENENENERQKKKEMEKGENEEGDEKEQEAAPEMD